MHNFVLAAKSRIFIHDGMQTVRAGGQDLVELVLPEGLDVLHCESLEEVLFTEPAG